jgi:hypothetical protein
MMSCGRTARAGCAVCTVVLTKYFRDMHHICYLSANNCAWCGHVRRGTRPARRFMQLTRCPGWLWAVAHVALAKKTQLLSRAVAQRARVWHVGMLHTPARHTLAWCAAALQAVQLGAHRGLRPAHVMQSAGAQTGVDRLCLSSNTLFNSCAAAAAACPSPAGVGCVGASGWQCAPGT